MEQELSDVLDNILGLLLLEGSYEVDETDEGFTVLIETGDAGRLIGVRGECLDSLQQLINQIMFRKNAESKRVILDVAGWRKQKEEELSKQTEELAKRVLESKEPYEFEPQPAWQRRIVHMVVANFLELTSESIGEGRDRHIVIKLKSEES